MIFVRENQPYPVVGTTSPIFIPSDESPKAIQMGECYFLLRVKTAQAAFTGPIWESTKALVVTSRVSLNHQILGADPVIAIQKSLPVQRHTAQQLGLAQTLIKLTPAVMSHVSIGVDFVLDRENRLSTLTRLINDNAFLATISLAPGAVAAARTVGSISQKLLQAFLPEQNRPLLQFHGDFDLAAELRDGYYVILGSADSNTPLPSPPYQIEIVNHAVRISGEPVTQLSYVVLEFVSVRARGRAANDGAEWDAKLRHAEAIATRVSGNPLIESSDRMNSWHQAIEFLREAQTLLLADQTYLASEAQQIVRAALNRSEKEILRPEPTRSSRRPPADIEAAFSNGKLALGIPADEDLVAGLSAYARDLAESRRVLLRTIEGAD